MLTFNIPGRRSVYDVWFLVEQRSKRERERETRKIDATYPDIVQEHNIDEELSKLT